MPIDYIPYFPQPIEGQAVLDNFTRTRRLLSYRDNDKVLRRIARGMPSYEIDTLETVGNAAEPQPSPPAPLPKGEGSKGPNLLIRGECLSACAYLKAQGIAVDLVYIDPPFASGADYAKKIYVRRNPKVAAALAKAEEELPDDQLRAFDEKMYGDIWTKEDYLNWMYENLMAIKAVMSDNASIYVHLDWHIGHYVKVLMDEVFGESRFLNDIIWWYNDKMPTGGNALDRQHDLIFQYVMGEQYTANPVLELRENPNRKREIRKKIDGQMVRIRDENGKQIWAEDNPNKRCGDVWRICLANSQAEERVDYATQKPTALLDRIISASSDEGMVVADFFGGSGVTAAVANKLGRRFIHVDVGINSIQTTRDRLQAAGASFTVLDVRDGVALFRNPVQTMDKLRSLITGLRLDEAELDAFWAGAFNDSRLGLVPVYLPDLKDHTTKVLDIPLINRIINVAMPDLPDKVKKVVIYTVDIDNRAAVDAFIKENSSPDCVIELRDLKELLSEVVLADEASISVSKKHVITFERFHSDRLQQKIAAYNDKHGLNCQPNGELLDELDQPPEPKPVKGFKPIEISEDGLELIEWVSADCTASEGPWHSDVEIKIDKRGLVSRDGKKSKDFWDAKLTCPKRPCRVKIRSIAGDETILPI
ncbi:MAG: site-specific DNA-methyltransferase [Lentisphaerota bacterium]